MSLVPTAFALVRLQASAPLLPALEHFYRDLLGCRVAGSKTDGVAVEVGETALEFLPASGSPFHHFALLLPGDRFEAVLDWARERVELLPDRETGADVFDFTNWDAKAVYFDDPAGNIVELIAHRGIGEAGAKGSFAAGELVGVSEVGLVCDPPSLAAALDRELGLLAWDGTVEGEERLAFVGEKARTLILCRTGRPWLPTGRPAEAHPVEIVLAGGEPEGKVLLPAGGSVRRGGAKLLEPCASRGTVMPMRALDDALPEFDVNEVHSVSLPCDPERAVRLALSAPAAPDRFVAALFRARGLPPDTTIQQLFGRMGFDTLAHTPTEAVFAASGTPWRPSGGLRPFAAAHPGLVRVAADIRALPAVGGCVLSTETRVQAVDEKARRAFRRYWLVVGPCSGLIRSRWLRAVERVTQTGG